MTRPEGGDPMRPPAPEPPFPVDPAKRIGVDVAPLSGPHIVWDERAPDFLEAKLAGLEASRARYRASAPWADADGLAATWRRLAERIATEWPALVRLEATGVAFPWLGLAVATDGAVADRAVFGAADPAHDAVNAAARGDGSDGAAPSEERGPRRGARSDAGREPRRLADLRVRARRAIEAAPAHLRLGEALALAVQEDLVVMRDDDAGFGAEWLAVSLPSHWDPGAHGGSDLRALHGPVPHGGRLRDAGPNLVRAMVHKGPFVRHVWALPTDARLDRHPTVMRTEVDEGPLVPQLWFRSERQTTLPLPDLHRSVFTIRVHQTPLAAVLGDPATERGRERRRRLAEALEAMSPELARYKSVDGFRARLIEELRS